MSETAAQRLHDAVNRHNIAWTDLTMRVAHDENISRDSAAEMVLGLIERRSVLMPVAIALIDMIIEENRNSVGGKRRASSVDSADLAQSLGPPNSDKRV